VSIILKDSDRKYFLEWAESGTQSGVLQLKTFDYIASGNTVILQLANTIDIGGSAFGSPIYISAYDTTTQTQTSAGASQSMSYNTIAGSNGISLTASNTHIVFGYAGTYNLQFSVQLDQSAGSGQHIYIWFAKNGIDIPYSASEVAIQGSSAEAIPSWNFIFDNIAAGDYVEIRWSVSNTGVVLQNRAATGVVPAIPSVIVTVWKI
jgi:hypothetical protein